jgi:PiT family inorganic phosphate transporter
MNAFLDEGLSGGSIALLLLCLAIAFGFEFANGFHDTANAVATVIYTHSLKPRVAVLISGICNFTGVLLGGIGVALGILNLLPVELLVSSGAGAGLAMVLALLISAILWNVGTWYFGLPASSSHTLIGAIVGVGLANSALPGHHFGDGVNWSKAEEVGMSLLLSPIVGFSLAALLLLLTKVVFKKYPALFEPPPKDAPPPTPIRALLTATCMGVSYSHGSNDGQKGVGIVMLVLMGLVPAGFALNRDASSATLDQTIAASVALTQTVHDHADPAALADVDKATEELSQVRSRLSGKAAVADIPRDQRFQVRQAILLADKSIDALVKGHKIKLTHDEGDKLAADRKALRSLTDYAPRWVLVAIAIALGVGTMVGWKRIVVTVGEKIGKSHLTYAQGASAELVAACTIQLASSFHLPVSTTHVLSSGIAGTMVAQKSGLQRSTVQSIALAWVLTLPVAMTLSAVLFLGFRAALAGGPPPPTAHVMVVSDVDAPLPAEQTLRLAGSTTIGDELAPTLAKAFLERQGATAVSIDAKDAKAHRVVVHGTLGGKPIQVEILATGSKLAFECLATDACDVGLSSRPVHPDEVERLKALGDMTQPSSEHIIGQDGVAVIVNKANPVATLTFDQLSRIFTGAITDWSALGGPAGPIKVLARDAASGTYDVFSALVTHGAPLKPTTSFDDSEALSRAVSADPGAIGFIGLPYVKDAKPVALRDGDGAPLYPTVFTIATEDYPLTRRLYLYIDDAPKNPLASTFIGFAQSDAGQHLVEEAGFISLAVRVETPPAPPGAPPRYTQELAGASRLSLDFRFRSGGVELDSKAVRDLDRVVAYLSLPQNRARQALLVGFADNQGQESANEGLSRLRAEALAKLLKQRGVVPAVTDGFGSALPVAPNVTPEGREKNRRVEVWVR